MRALSWLVAAALFLTIGGLALLAGTESGLRLGFDLLARVLPAELAAESISGRLIGPLELTGLRYHDPATTLTISRLYLDWQPAELLSGRLHLRRVEVEDTRVRTTDDTPDDEPLVLPEVRLPLRIQIDELRVADLRVAQDGVPPLEALVLRGSADGQHVRLDELAVRIPDFDLSLAGGIDLGTPYAADLALRWEWREPAGNTITGAGRLEGPITALRVEHATDGAVEARLAATVRGLPDALAWEGQLDLARLDPALLPLDLPPIDIAGTVSSQGDPRAFTVDGTVHVEEPQTGESVVRLDAKVAGDRVEVKRLAVTQPGSDLALTAVGHVSLGDTPRADIDLRWQALRWPLQGDLLATSPEGQLSVTGGLDAYDFHGKAQLRAPDAPDVQLELVGTGDQHRAHIERLVLALLDGRVTAQGDLGWDPQPQWDLRIGLQKLNPGVKWPEWAGRIGGDIQSRGQLTAAGPQVSVTIDEVAGELRGYPVRLAGGVAMTGAKAVSVEGLVLDSGGASLRVDGTVSDTLALEWAVEAGNLGQLLPQASGALEGEGRLTGSLEQPHVVATLKGAAIRFQDHGLERLDGDVDVSLAPTGPFQVLLKARGIRSGENTFGNLQVEGQGRPRAHTLTLNLTEGDLGIAATLALAGGFEQDETWSGRLERADLSAGKWGDWRLQSPAKLALGPAIHTDSLCWVSSATRLCVAGDLTATGAWEASADLDNFALARIQPLLPKAARVTGAIEAQITAAGTPDGRLQADAQVRLPGAAITVPIGDEPRELDLSQGLIEATVDSRGLAAEARLEVGDLATVDGDLILLGWSPRVETISLQPVTARLVVQVPDLAWLKAFAPELGEVAGSFGTDINLAGTVGEPRIAGLAQLENGRVELPAAGVAIDAVRFSARSQGGDRVTYDGRATMGDGTLTLSGDTRLDAQAGWPTRLEVDGVDLLVMDTDEVWLLASPDMQITMEQGRIRVGGEILVPRGRIRPREIATKGPVAVSSDVVIKGAESTEEGEPMPVAASVRLRLGERVSFEGFGLRGRLEGNLLVTQTPGKEPVANGQLGIVDGVYSGLSKDLEIVRGRVSYASSPLDNPGLDIRAITRNTTMVAGVHITGPARDPNVEFFSDPPRPQAEIVSYLLLGRPLGSGGAGMEGEQLKEAAALAGGSLVASEIGRRFGLDDIRVEGGEEGAMLTVGQYVTPKLYMGYVTGIRNAMNRLRVIYDLTKRIQIQTETGDQQAVDIFYTIDR